MSQDAARSDLWKVNTLAAKKAQRVSGYAKQLGDFKACD